MKRFLAFVLIITLCIGTLGGCTFGRTRSIEDADLSDVVFDPANYNNYGGVTVSGDMAIYPQFSSFDTYLCLQKGEERYRLFGEKDLEDSFFSGPYYGLDNAIYFPVYSNEAEDSSLSIYRYVLGEKKLEALLHTDSIYSWLPMDDAIVYLREFDAHTGISSLYYYDLKEKTEYLIATEVEEFMVVDGLIRYIVYEDGYRICSYDPVLKADLYHDTITQYSQKETVSFYFTKDRVILLPETANEYQDQPEYTVYDLPSQTSYTYHLPNDYYSFIPGDRYAYVQTFFDLEKGPSVTFDLNEEEAMYQIDLTTGEATLLEIDATSIDDIYVDAEDRLYLMKYIHIGSFFDQTKILYYNPDTKESEKMFSY